MTIDIPELSNELRKNLWSFLLAERTRLEPEEIDKISEALARWHLCHWN